MNTLGNAGSQASFVYPEVLLEENKTQGIPRNTSK